MVSTTCVLTSCCQDRQQLKCTAPIFGYHQIYYAHNRKVHLGHMSCHSDVLLYVESIETVKLSSETIFKSCGVRFHFARMVLYIKQMVLKKQCVFL